MYQLVSIDADKNIALKSVKYLFLFPSAFILSGIFSESLFILLLILCFYCGKREKWALVGLFGFCLSMTRPLGVFVFIPLAMEYMRVRNYQIQKIRPNIFFLLLIPVGLCSFFLYCYFRSGNFWAFIIAKQTGWYISLQNPLAIVGQGLALNLSEIGSSSIEISQKFNSVFLVIYTFIFLLHGKKIYSSYFILGLVCILLPLSTGGFLVMLGMQRFLLVIFPFFIILGKLSSKYSYADQTLTLFLCLMQGFLMALWVCGFHLVI